MRAAVRTHIFVHLLLTLHRHYLRAWNRLGMLRNFVVRLLIVRFGRNPRVSHIPDNTYLAYVSPIPLSFSLPPNPTPFLTPASNALNYPAFLETKLSLEKTSHPFCKITITFIIPIIMPIQLKLPALIFTYLYL